MQHIISTGSIGYIIDFIAGLWIIRSIILRRQKHIDIESQQLWAGNPLQHEGQLKSFSDGWVGGIQLFIGLIFHLREFEIQMGQGIYILISVIVISINASWLSMTVIRNKMSRVYGDVYDTVKKRAVVK